MLEGDVGNLRRSGLDDRQILSVVLITSLFAFMTRVADGLGAEFSERRLKSIEKWLSGLATEQKWLMTPAGDSTPGWLPSGGT